MVSPFGRGFDPLQVHRKKRKDRQLKLIQLLSFRLFFVLLSSEMGGWEFRTSIFIFTVAIRKRPCVRKTNNYGVEIRDYFTGEVEVL